MILVTFYNALDGAFCLQMEGHAGGGRKGRDLICAGASTLAHTLGEAVQLMERVGMLACPAHVQVQAGEAEIVALPRPEYLEEAALVFWTVQVGLSRLAEAYPRNVQLEGSIRLEQKGVEEE